ncbi:phosphatidate cytidylyltransferase [Blakeslea trispora]|nr:phosphatidate cytidylyltransferase [Blakeslea trispora]
MRFKTGSSMLGLFIGLLMSKDVRLITLLTMLIQAKVFQELRRIKLTPQSVHAEDRIYKSDWVLLLGAFVLNQSYPDALGSYILHASWVHLCIFYTLPQPILIYYNINKGGIFWFLFPSMLIICNDITAYACGRCFGKTKLLNLSPNKTLEGFIGALVLTVIFACAIATPSYQFDGFAKDNISSGSYIRLHAIIFALFASLVGPFGGFFASAVKRASGVKDFDDFIPGHGGLSDRVDCQLFMAVFTFVYYNSFIAN